MGSITVSTSLAGSPTINVPVTVTVPQPIQLYPPQVMVNAAPDHWTTNQVTIHGNSTNLLVLSNPKVSDSRIQVEIKPMLPAKGSFNLLVEFPPGFQLEPGKTAEVTIESNHRRSPLIRIPIKEYPHPRPPAATLAARPNRPPMAGPVALTNHAVLSTAPGAVSLTTNAALTHQPPPPPPPQP
jgi:hypothetical protein